jgi:hypothetical protein
MTKQFPVNVPRFAGANVDGGDRRQLFELITADRIV